ncbi:hypothetical protein ACRRTK_023957 [Alexandromys fortis]
MEPGLVLNQADLHLFPGTLRRAAEPTPPTFIVPSEPQEKEDENSRQGGRRHSMPATLCCQPRRSHLDHLSHLRCPVADSLMSSSLDNKSFSPSKIGLCGSLTASAQPSCSPYHPLGAEKLWSLLGMALRVTPKGSSLGDTLQEEVTTRQEEAISHGQPQDARPASSRNQRCHRWQRGSRKPLQTFFDTCVAACLLQRQTMPPVRTRLHSQGILEAPTEPALRFQDTEVWLIRAPPDFAPQCLNGWRVPLSGSKTVKGKLDGKRCRCRVLTGSPQAGEATLLASTEAALKVCSDLKPSSRPQLTPYAAPCDKMEVTSPNQPMSRPQADETRKMEPHPHCLKV